TIRSPCLILLPLTVTKKFTLSPSISILVQSMLELLIHMTKRSKKEMGMKPEDLGIAMNTKIIDEV
ncbi:hypothetical protein D7X33_52550, partial [Butyricicoccus sp. 1XD8-22]